MAEINWRKALKPLPLPAAGDLYARLRRAQELAGMGWTDAAVDLLASVVEALEERFPRGAADKLYAIAWGEHSAPKEDSGVSGK